MKGIWLISLGFLGCGALPTGLAPLDVPADCTADLTSLDEAHPALACALAQARRGGLLTETAQITALLADREPAGPRRDQLAAEGVRAAEAALARQPDDGVAHYLLALNLGIAVQDDLGLAVKSLETLEKHLTRAVDLAPGTHEGGPLRVLGLLCLRAPAWPDGPGDPDRALELLTRAATEFPTHPQNHLALAEALEADDPTAARAALDAADAALTARDRGPVGRRWAREIRDRRSAL